MPEGDAAPLEIDERSGSAIRQILADIRSLGYGFSFGVVDAADFGAPQHRLRFILIGSSDGRSIALPRPTHGDRRTRHATVRDAIFDLRDKPGPHSVYTDDVRKLFDLVPEGGSWRSLPKHLHRVALGNSYDSGGGKTGFFRRLSWDTPSPTITGKANRKGSSVCHPDRTRPISVRELARLQGFPDDWEFIGAMNRQYLQVGNAVPTQLGRAVGDALKRADVSSLSPDDWELMLDLALKRLRASARNKVSRRPEQPEMFELVA